MPRTLCGRIDAVLEEKSMLKHPFYQAWSNGNLTKEALRQYACQYYHFVRDFPRMVSAVHSNTPDIALRQELLTNLVDEEQGSDNHPALWMRFANALGASREQVEATPPLPETQALVETMMASCRQGAYHAGMATLYAYEVQIPEVSRVKIEGLKQFYGIEEAEAIRFFTVHREADVYHSRAERHMIEQHTPASEQDRTVQAADRTATALWRFLDGVYASYVGRKNAMC
jgi:pyrroloquinoline-quinone synthase